MVHPSYRMFTVYDPTCDEPEDTEPAVRGAIGDLVGWSTGVVAVSTVLDVARVSLEVEVWDGPPGELPDAELRREHDVAFPSGRFAVDKSAEDRFLRGLDLPPGPGTYRCRVLGLHRAEVRQAHEAAYAQGSGAAADRAIAALDGRETYHVQLWQISPHPRWDDDER